MFGNLSGAAAASLWYKVQTMVEQSWYGGQQQLGFSADLVKAFNHLPRIPVLAALGLDEGVLRAWSGALCGLERRFRIRSSSGPALKSSEGCGMSCVAMAITNLALHAHVRGQVPTSGLATFVDNWEGMADCHATLEASYRALCSFTSAWDLLLDEDKTFVWASDPAHRQELRAGCFRTVLQCRELGAHMQFSRRCTNSTLVNRFKALEPMWHQLRASFAPLHQKIHALSSAAWPRAFYAVANVHLCSSHFRRLRAGAMRGLALDRPGANSAVQLSGCLGPRYDPEFVALKQTFVDARSYLPHAEAVVTIGQALRSRSRAPGPVGVLLERAALLEWQWLDAVQCFCDGIGVFDLWELGPQELELRMNIAWQQRVAALAEHRPDFQGMAYVDQPLSRRLARELGPKVAPLLHVAMNGSFFTNDKLCL